MASPAVTLDIDIDVPHVTLGAWSQLSVEHRAARVRSVTDGLLAEDAG